MRKPAHDRATDLLLSSISDIPSQGMRASFLYGPPDSALWPGTRTAEIYYSSKKLNRAALYVRQEGPAYLKYLAIEEIRQKLQEFTTQNFWYLAQEATNPSGRTYNERISAAGKERFSDALANSEIIQPANHLTLFPLVCIKVESDFRSQPFFLVSPSSLVAELPSHIDPAQVCSTQFPPISDWKGAREIPSAWLGIRSPDYEVSRKMRAAILGAMALTPVHRQRYVFSGRHEFGGRCTFTTRGATVSDTASHTPPLMHDIVISAADEPWLRSLSLKLDAETREIRRELRALEYYYRAWPLDPSIRFPILCMTLDAIFGDASHATQAVIEGVQTVVYQVNAARLRDLLELRASVIHGGAPDVYDSRKYGRYYDRYEADPIHDLELVITTCLRSKIFGGSFRENPDPHEKTLADARRKGLLPPAGPRGTILEDAPR
jgi:hypothetical protein